MKKWLFVISPAAMLAVFLVFYYANRAESERREHEHQVQLDKQKADADEKKKIAEQKAHEDAERRNQERLADEAKVAKDKQDKYDATMAKIQDQTNSSNATAEKFAKEVSELTIELDTLHKQKDALTRETFDLAKKVEQGQVERRNADMDIQRMTDMIAQRADQSAMAKMPPPPPPPKQS
jgi:hypothetical protein